MPLVYTIGLATAGNITTNSSANTETDYLTIKPGVRNVGLSALYVLGKGAALTAISGIVHRIVNYATASTGGTGITPTPKDPGLQAAKATVASSPTAGSTRTNYLSFGCGAAGPGGWIARTADDFIVAQGSGSNSTDVLCASGTVSLAFEFSGEIVE
jgi:hypothetical protein